MISIRVRSSVISYTFYVVIALMTQDAPSRERTLFPEFLDLLFL